MDVEEARVKTYYEILGVPFDASPQQIRETYKDLARLYHPDSNYYADLIKQGPSPEQVELYKIITSAYQTLIDPNKRSVYDEKVKPLLTGSFQKWEDKSDDFFNEKKPTRARQNTFGVANHDPMSEAELKSFRSTRVTQIIKRQKRKPKLAKLAFIVLIVAALCITAAIVLVPPTPPAKIDPLSINAPRKW